MKTIVEQFLETVHQYPEYKAVSDETGSFTFSEVNSISAHIAAAIAVHNKPDHEVRYIAVIFPRKKEALPAFLGVLRSGNCYVFSAPDAPAERLEFILSDASITTVVTTREAASMLRIAANMEYIYVDDILEEIKNGKTADENYDASRMDDAAFITYTSGSTGKPKGAVNSYYYIANHNRARHYFYTPAAGECIGNIVSFSYAASTYDLFSGLTVGCNLYIFSDEELLSQATLVKRVIENDITTMFMIPSMIPVVFAEGAELPIKWVITAGEKAKKVPKISAKIAEIYGSSEAAAVIGRVLTLNDPWDLLGKPMPGTELYLINENGDQIKEAGVVGELCVINDALTMGYLGRPEENAQKFRVSPFGDGRRMYVSGDLMKFDDAGNYYYCGRKDNMTKINGQRVEMGEIESTIVKHEAIEDAVCEVLIRNRASMLVCYYLKKHKDVQITADELTKFVAERLPRYMVPLYWVEMEAFPKNINGKTDRKAMPVPDFDAYSQNVPASGYLEEKLLEIARKLLPDIQFGVTDNLLQLGMDSIAAVQYVNEIEKLDSRFTVSDVMRLKTIRAIVSTEKETAWFYQEYDPQKPAVVLVHGIVPISGLSKVCETFSKLLNVYIIEPFVDHIEKEVGRYHYDALIDYYMGLLKKDMPENSKLWGFAGFSFGGQLAVSMAECWRRETGQLTRVLMGDTLVQLIYPGKVFPVLDENDPYIKMVTERGKKYGDNAVNEPIEITLKKQNAVLDLLRTLTGNTPYDGPVAYLDAAMDYDDATQQIKIAAAKKLYKNITIFEFHDYFHNDLYLKDEMAAFYLNYFKSTIRDGI